MTSVCYPPQACIKINRYLPVMVGGNVKETSILYRKKVICHTWTWNSITFCIWVGKSNFFSTNDTSLKVFSMVLDLIFESNTVKLKCCVTNMFKRSPTSVKIILQITLTILKSILNQSNLFYKTWHEFCVVSPPATDCFLLNLAHYIGSWSRNLL